MASPYAGLDVTDWKAKTRELIAEHPLTLETIREVALQTWGVLWQTKIGEGETAITLDEIAPPATVIGYFFEKLFAHELARRFPQEWRGTKGKEEKDLVYHADPKFSVEMKSSGQLGIKLFGNRSYNQKTANEGQIVKIEKSGYYITINFYGQIITLLRFGWIDQSDWVAQASATGQAASLKEEVYTGKLVEIPGAYRLQSPVGLLPGVGLKTSEHCAKEGITTFSDLLNYTGSDKVLLGFKAKTEKMEGLGN